MSQFFPPKDNEALKDKVVVLTGGAMGIGAALTELLYTSGAHVFFGDIESDLGTKHEQNLKSANNSSNHIQFVRTDVSSYESNLALFQAAYEKFGRVDHAISAAGVTERGNLLDKDLTLESVKQPPNTRVVDINLTGVIYFARIASVYLRQGETKGTDKSLTLVSSVAGFTEAPGLSQYAATKHGVLGLSRSAKEYLPTVSNIRTNAICPWMTETRMVSGIEDDWHKAGLPRNKPMDVAKVIAGVLTDGKLNGEALFVEGGRAWMIEQNIDNLRPQWLGEKQASEFARGQKVLGTGDNWAKNG